VATGRAWDADMRSRIGEHQARRGAEWQTHEEPLALAQKLHELDDDGCVVLIDCLTLWVTNLMMEERRMGAEFANLTEQVSQSKARLIFVSNEVGLGIVPDNKMARDFRDHAGRLHQQIAAVARDVYFIAAGLPLKMKG
jgi:adenosylcobinamide kinase / adenosylcobinamide-phosphate guanylyltransferase